MVKFKYIKFTSLNEAVDFINQREGARLFLGGTDLLVDIRHETIQPDYVVDVKAIPDLKELKETEKGLEIGAGVTLNEICNSEYVNKHVPILAQGCHSVASYSIRNRATMVGNMCTASPAGDTSVPLICTGAVVNVVGKNGSREIPVEKFYQGPKKNALERGELVVSVTIPAPYPRGKGIYYKSSRTGSVDLATVGVGVQLDGEEYKVAVGACAPTPVRAKHVEEALNKKGNRNFEQVAGLVEKDISPIDDLRGSAEYRYHMAKVLVRRGLEEISKGE